MESDSISEVRGGYGNTCEPNMTLVRRCGLSRLSSERTSEPAGYLQAEIVVRGQRFMEKPCCGRM